MSRRFYPNKNDMENLRHGKLILDEWYPFLKTIDTIQLPNSIQTYAPFRTVWSASGGYQKADWGHPNGPNGPEKQHLIRREGGTGEMFFFARELQKWVDYMWHHHRDAFKSPPEMLDAYQQYSIRYTEPLLWDRPGWYVECVQQRRTNPVENEDEEIIHVPYPQYDGGAQYPWPIILIGYSVNAHAREGDDRIKNMEHVQNPMTAYSNDFKSLHCMCIEYAADGKMQYRLIWEQTGKQASEELKADDNDNTWSEPSGNEEIPAIIPISWPIDRLFKTSPEKPLIVNFPFTNITNLL